MVLVVPEVADAGSLVDVMGVGEVDVMLGVVDEAEDAVVVEEAEDLTRDLQPKSSVCLANTLSYSHVRTAIGIAY